MAKTDTKQLPLERYGLRDEQLRAIFRNMLLQRQLDNRGFQLNRQGKVPFALGSEGHEALQAGAAMAFRRGHDLLAPYYRDLGLAVGIGLSAYEIMLSIFARAADHNEWAISTPLDKQMAQPEIWKRAAGYGMPGKRFNGFDPVETYGAVNEAMERARSGGGPTLLEGTCYRFLAHSTDDNDMTYRTKDEVTEHRKNDPVPRFEAVLIEHGIMTAADVEAMRKDVLRETNDATDRAEAMPYPQAADLYTNVYEGAWQPWQ